MVFSLRSWGYGQYGAHALGVTDDVDVDAPGQIDLGSLSGRAPRCIAAGPVHGVLVTGISSHPLLFLSPMPKYMKTNKAIIDESAASGIRIGTYDTYRGKRRLRMGSWRRRTVNISLASDLPFFWNIIKGQKISKQITLFYPPRLDWV